MDVVAAGSAWTSVVGAAVGTIDRAGEIERSEAAGDAVPSPETDMAGCSDILKI